ncbi:carboxypeptidase M32 [Ammoniphilus sp. YIM 78166]|uniref:carboxypeptidase M32 n=1 Tax=Ammoniphilus sp. YIM 78166 TaxID=1644106 RepID=UPI001F1028A2|nr:carboxypeptidase M32 [Ammoniphilus sp. YIM 78166]
MTIEQTLLSYKELEQRICHLNSISSLVHWDMETTSPKLGLPYMSEAVGTLALEIFRLTTSDEMKEYLGILTAQGTYEQLDQATQASLREAKRQYDQTKKIPEALYKEYSILTANAQRIWQEAKAKNEFSLFEPSLQRIIEINREFANYYGYEEHPYDALLDQFEPGYTVKVLDELFNNLRTKTLDLLHRIQQSSYRPETGFLSKTYPKAKQKEFCQSLLHKLGYQTDAGLLAESAHPFATGISLQNVRITTNYHEDDIRSAVTSVIHELGHAVYEQNILKEYEGTFVRDGASMGIHESQSRFFENMIGRSEAFWQHLYPALQEQFPDELGSVSMEQFQRSLNIVEPSLIRIEADELTYNLHIMLRYELEKAMMAGELNAKDLPQAWNQKVEEYLGLVPPTDTVGVLQDIHWCFAIGYFPSYTLGNLYSAQLYQKVRKEFPHFDQLVVEGNLQPILDWLHTHIHQHGKLYTPSELIERATGEKLNAEYLVRYFDDKFTRIYHLS